jgi:ATP phosphoribosyltransferase
MALSSKERKTFNMLNVALPKGRLGDKVYNMLASIGYECKEILEDSRKLIFVNEKNGVKYFLVKPSDVAIYVENGAADIGVVGKDILLESEADVYELLDLGFGKCKMCVAALNDFRDNTSRPLRVATKFTNMAKTYYDSINREIELVKLNGSVELAPILGLSDVIFDIVETGKTLVENGLSVKEEVVPISARLIVNKSSYFFKTDEINTIVRELGKEKV